MSLVTLLASFQAIAVVAAVRTDCGSTKPPTLTQFWPEQTDALCRQHSTRPWMFIELGVHIRQ
jgi:hypothetical protein